MKPVKLESLEPRCHLHGGTTLANAFAVNANGPAFEDQLGNTWEADEGFSTSRTTKLRHNHAEIAGTDLDGMYSSTRQDYSLYFGHKIPNGTYTVNLYFTEQEYAARERVFDVTVEGKTVLKNFDIYRMAGGQNIALMMPVTTTVTDGKLDIDFLSNGNARASVSGIAVEPADTGATPSSSDTFNPGKIAWSTKASAPIKREEAVSFVSGGKLYVYGGYTDSAYHATTRMDVYNPATNSWKRLKDGPSKITHAGLAIDPKTGIVWMLAGFIGNFPSPQGTTTVWKYNPKSDSWSKGPSLPEARGSGGAGIVNDKLYFFSGATADRKNDSDKGWSLELDDSSAKWMPIAPILKKRNHFAFATVGGKIYVFGGQTHLESNSVTTKDCEVYDPATNKWSYLPSLPTSYSHFSFTTSVYKNRYILMAGGENPHNGAKAEVMIFDTVTRKWAKLTSLPSPRRAAGGGIIGDMYVVSGGYLRSRGMNNDTWVADLTKLGL